MRGFQRWINLAGWVLVVISGPYQLAAQSAASPPDELTDSVGLRLRFVPAGNFVQGEGRDAYGFFKDHGPQTFEDQLIEHPVRLTKPVYVAATEVTVGQFRRFVEDSGYQTTAEKANGSAVGFKPVFHQNARQKQPFNRGPEFTWKNPGFEQTAEHPVVCVSWHDAQAFCQWLSRKEGVKYRLPTEAEWERACRAGTRTTFSFGASYRGVIHQQANVANVELEQAHKDLVSRQWFIDVKRDPGDGFVYTAPVGRFPANAWGLCDFHGNVWEWCQDVYSDTFYAQYKSPRYPLPHGTAVDPLNETPWNEFGDWRVIRGGAWSVAPMFSRSDARGFFDAPDAACYVGFRVVREAPAAAVALARHEWEQEQAATAALLKVIGNFRIPNYSQVDRLAPFSQQPPTPDVTQGLYRISRLTSVQANQVEPIFLEHVAKIPLLKSLEIYDLRHLNDGDLAALAGKTSLEELHLKGGSKLTNACLSHLVELTNLKRLTLSGSELTDEGLVLLRQLKQLEELNLQYTGAKGALLTALGEVPLKKLSLPDLKDEHAARLSNLPLLESVSCFGPALTGSGFAHFARLKQLTELHLAGCRSIPQTAFGPLGSLTKLTALDLSQTEAGDDAVELLKSHPRLSNLFIGSESLTNQGLREIAEIISLENLVLRREAVHVTDEGFSGFWRLHRLRYLAIEIPGLTGAGLAPLAELPALDNVRVSSSALTDEALDHLSAIPNLRYLSIGSGQLDGLAAITEDGLMMLAEAKHLEELTIGLKNTNLTDEAINRLKQAKPRLRVTVHR